MVPFSSSYPFQTEKPFGTTSRITWRSRENTETEVKEAKLDKKPLTAMELDDAAWGEPKGPTPGRDGDAAGRFLVRLQSFEIKAYGLCHGD